MQEAKPMRRKDRQVSEKRAREIIQNAEYGVFMMADLQGQPYGVAVSHAMEGDNIYFHCALEGRKLDMIQENPKVCISCVSNTYVDQEAFTHRYESAVAEGIAVIVENREEKLHALRLITGKFAPQAFKDSDAYILPRMDQTGVVRIEIKTISGKVNAKE